MSKHKGHPLKAIRLGHDRIRLDFTHQGRRVRGEVTADALAALILGEVNRDSNLAADEPAISLADFIDLVYVPIEATQRLKKNAGSLDAEIDLVKPWRVKLGSLWLHEVKDKDAERCKDEWLVDGYAGNTIKRRWHCLGRILECARRKGKIKTILLGPVPSLDCADRSSIWLRLEEIDALLVACEAVNPMLRLLVEFLILTGARIGEARLLRVGDIRDGKVWLPTQKQKCPARDAMRCLDIKSLGPKFASLVQKLKPHPVTGLYFYANVSKMTAFTESYAIRLFKVALAEIGRTDFTLHDLRGTFVVHRSLVIDSFRRLQVELGQGDPKSIQAYLDKARQFDRRESIFYEPPRKRRRTPGNRPGTPPPLGPAAHEGKTPPSPFLS